MLMKPDIFLLIVISCGACIIIVGMVIVINFPLGILSCLKCRSLFDRICPCCRKKVRKKSWNGSTINFPGGKRYTISLVEGQPQGPGFFTAGPWSSTETTSTWLGNEIMSQINNITEITKTSTVTLHSDHDTETPTLQFETSSGAKITICMACNGRGMVNVVLPHEEQIEDADNDTNHHREMTVAHEQNYQAHLEPQDDSSAWQWDFV